jgi:arginyl-tRNA synthetase
MSAPAPGNLAEQSISDPIALLESTFREAIVATLGEAFREADPLIKPSGKPEFGDFQANAAMGLGKKLGKNPRELAQQLAETAGPALEAIAQPLEIAGPGFINITFKPEALANLLLAMDDDSLGVTTDPDQHPVVIDLCSVNVAKQMHVGHLRSTIIGQALTNVFERRGRKAIRQNHLGDWGLPIALVLYHLKQKGVDLATLELPELDVAYREAQLEVKSDIRGLASALEKNAGPHRLAELEEQNAGAQQTLEEAKAMLVKLQRGDEQLLADWHQLIDCTMHAVYESLELMGVDLGPEHNDGESFYRDRLDDVINDFLEQGIAEEDHGALIVRFPEQERPLLIRKSDGGYLYATTDLAAVKYRTTELGSDRMIYVVDARQRDHFRDVFQAAHLIGYDRTLDGTPAELIHIGFGSVLGEDKKPLKTRSGKNITLKSLLMEAIERGTTEVTKRAEDPKAPTHDLSPEELGAIGKAVGIGAVKYADLSNDLGRDYIFNFDRMIAFEGNTGPYLQYAHARVCSIFSKAALDPEEVREAPIRLIEPSERDLALRLLRYGSTVKEVELNLEPHRLCTYLYEMANAYSSFYQNCPVLKAEDDSIRRSRLHLCDLVRRVMADGLGLLGIDAPTRM